MPPTSSDPSEPPALQPIVLLPLSDAEYADFAERQVHETARQRQNAGEWTADEALAGARAVLADLLADRLRGAGHQFFKGVTADGLRVGWLWVGPAPPLVGEGRERARWLAQITVDEPVRGRGYGRALLDALHADLRRSGVEALWLRVYTWNIVAKRLYISVGYELVRQFETDAHMRKLL